MKFWPKRSWFRFHLSTAIIAVIVVGAAVGIYIRYYYENDEWHRALRETLDGKITFDWNETPLHEAVSSLPHQRRVYTFYTPELDQSEVKITLNVHNMAMKDALTQLCKVANAEWDVRNGAILIYSAGKPPPLPKMPSWGEGWDSHTLGQLSRGVSLEMLDTPLSEAVSFMGSLTKVKVVIDPKLSNPDARVTICPVESMRFDDTLTWMCFQTGTEWKLRKNSAGDDEIWITAQSK